MPKLKRREKAEKALDSSSTQKEQDTLAVVGEAVRSLSGAVSDLYSLASRLNRITVKLEGLICNPLDNIPF